MSKALPLPKTLQEAITFLSDEQRTFDYAVKLRWPDGAATCPRCGSKEHSFISTRRLWFCKGCKKQFTAKVGTIFEDSALGMDKWMIAVWMIVNCKNGISSYEIHRALGITQKSAWFMTHRIRLAMQSKSFVKLGGPSREVEVDETFIGGKARNMHLDKRERRITGTGTTDKVAVMGMLESGGRIRLAVLPNRKKWAMQQRMRNDIAAGSGLYSDALRSYDGLAQCSAHRVIDYAERHVDGQVHTNGLENFWSPLKRGIRGTYVNIEPFHLFRYLDEQAFRYNNRGTKENLIKDGDRFLEATKHIVGRRVTYQQLTGKDSEIHHETANPGPA